MAEDQQERNNQIFGDSVAGDKVEGDKIHIDQITDEAIALIGRHARANITKNYGDTYIMPGQAPQLFAGVPGLPRYGLVGRDQLLAELLQQVTSRNAPAYAIAGKGGAGKTAVAVAAAYHKECLAHFEDGILWASLGPSGDPLLQLGRWAEALGLDPAQFPDAAELKLNVKNVIGNRKLLLVLDDIWNADHVPWLQCGGPSCAHLLTTRNNQIAAQFAGGPDHVLNLPDLDSEAALDLLSTIAHDVVAAAGSEALDLLNEVGGLPLAVELLGGYLVAGGLPQAGLFADLGQEKLHDLARPGLRLQQAKAKLEDGSGRKVRLGDLLALSLQSFTEEEKASFFALGAFAPKPATFGRAAAEAVSQAGGPFLLRLVNHNLLEIEGAALAMHQVLHDLARQQMGAAAQARHAAHYLALIEDDPGNWQTIDAAYSQIRWAWHHLPDQDCLDWIFLLREHQVRRGYWQETLQWQQRALSVARQLDLKNDWAWLLNGIAYTYDDLGQRQKAFSTYQEALPIMRQIGDRDGQATTLNNLANIYMATGHAEKAIDHYQKALSIYAELDDQEAQSLTLNNIGELYRSTGRPQQATDYFKQALNLIGSSGDRALRARTLNNLALIYQAAGRSQEALSLFNEVLPVLQADGDRSMEARVFNNVGELYRNSGQPQQALNYYTRALDIARQIGDRELEGTTLNNLAMAYQTNGQIQQALALFEQALPIMRQVGLRSGEARILNNMAVLYQTSDQPQQALALFQQSLPIMQEVGDLVGVSSTLNNMGMIEQALDNPQQALHYYSEALPMMRQVDFPAGEVTVLGNMALLLHGLGRRDQALDAIQAAIDLFQVGLTHDAAGAPIEMYHNMRQQLQDQVP